MEIRPIRNDDDHIAALQEIEKLWGAAPDTEESDKLDILATLVEKYEESRWPSTDEASDPIDLLNYAIEELGHSQARTCRVARFALPRLRIAESATSTDRRNDPQDRPGLEDSG